jgi:hypothetical protein
VASPAPLNTPDEVSPVDWVNTYIGTGGGGGGGGSDYGGTMPFVTTPFGTTNWTAQTRQNSISVSHTRLRTTPSRALSERISLQSGWATMAT